MRRVKQNGRFPFLEVQTVGVTLAFPLLPISLYGGSSAYPLSPLPGGRSKGGGRLAEKIMVPEQLRVVRCGGSCLVGCRAVFSVDAK